MLKEKLIVSVIIAKCFSYNIYIFLVKYINCKFYSYGPYDGNLLTAKDIFNLLSRHVFVGVLQTLLHSL